MPLKNLVDMTLVIDRSGSMQKGRADSEGGINALIEERKTSDQKTNLTLVTFDDEYEVIHNGVPVRDVPEFTLQPRGNTALLDAIGTAILAAQKRIGAMAERKKPGLVVFVIVTDGGENQSRKFSHSVIKDLIESLRPQGWQFTFLGADVDAFSTATQLGIPLGDTANYSKKMSGQTYAAVGQKINRMSSNVARGARGMSISSNFSDQERESMKIDNEKK